MSEISEAEIKAMTKEQNYIRGYKDGKSDVLDKIREEIVDTLYVDSLIFGELIDFKNGKISADDVIEEFNRVTSSEVLQIINKYREGSDKNVKNGLVNHVSTMKMVAKNGRDAPACITNQKARLRNDKDTFIFD